MYLSRSVEPEIKLNIKMFSGEKFNYFWRFKCKKVASFLQLQIWCKVFQFFTQVLKINVKSVIAHCFIKAHRARQNQNISGHRPNSKLSEVSRFYLMEMHNFWHHVSFSVLICSLPTISYGYGFEQAMSWSEANNSSFTLFCISYHKITGIFIFSLCFQ